MRFQWNRILACSVCVLCLLWFGFGRSPLPVQAAAQVWQTQHDQAIALARAGEFKAAVSLFAELRGKYPAAAPLLFDSALVLHWAGEDKAATDFYETKLRARPDVPNYVKEAMANAYVRQGRFAEALPLVQERAASGEKRWRLLAAELLIRLQNPAEAQKIYEAYLAANPQDMEVLISRGQARLQNGDSRRAADDFELARQLTVKQGDAGRHKEVEALLAVASIRSNDLAKAILLLRPYIEKDQATPAMQSDYVDALRTNGNLEAAIAAAEKLWPDPAKAPVYGLRILADCYLRISKFDTALQLYAVVLQKEPQNHLAKLGSALAQVQLGRVPEALKNYEQVMSANPRMAEVVMDDCLFYVAQGRLWTARQVFALVNTKMPNNTAFLRQYADRLNTSGLPREAFKYYQLLRGLPGGDTAGTAGMARAAAATGDAEKARQLLDSLSQEQLRTPAAAQALREYQEMSRGKMVISSAYFNDYKGKDNYSASMVLESRIGGNFSVLAQTGRMRLRDTNTGDVAEYWTSGPGIRVTGMNYDFSVWANYNGMANMDGYQTDLTLHINDFSSVRFFSGMAPVNEAQAVVQRIMNRTFGASYSWRKYNIPAALNKPRTEDVFTVSYSTGKLTDGNATYAIGLNWDRILRDDQFKRIVWSSYLSQSRYAFLSPYYDSPDLRYTLGTGLAYRQYVHRGYWEGRAFFEMGADRPAAWSFSPFVRLEYGHYFNTLLYGVIGCEYGITTGNSRYSPAFSFSKFQCDLNLNLLW